MRPDPHPTEPTRDGVDEFWEVSILRVTVSAYNRHTGEIRELHFGGIGGRRGYANIESALRALGRTIDADRTAGAKRASFRGRVSA